MQEYYIRTSDSDETRGPFTHDQLASLGEMGHLGLDALIYNPETEAWEVLETNQALREIVFPEKKRLTVKAREDFQSINKNEDELPAVTINDLLAAAEGLTEDTRHRKKVNAWKEKAAVAAMFILGTSLLFSAIGLIWLSRDIVFAFDVGRMITSPLVIIAFIDLAVGMLMFLQSPNAYPFLRFRAALGCGFFIFFFWAVGEPGLLLTSAVGALGIYGLTLFLQQAPFIILSAMALLGMLGFAALSFTV